MSRNGNTRSARGASAVLATPTAVRAVDLDQPIGDIVLPAFAERTALCLAAGRPEAAPAPARHTHARSARSQRHPW